MTDEQAGGLSSLPVPLQQSVDATSRKPQGTARAGDLLRDLAVIADQSHNDPFAASRSKPILTRRASNDFPSTLSILATQPECGAAELADRHGLLCAGCYVSNANLGAVNWFQNDDRLACTRCDNAGSNLQLQRRFWLALRHATPSTQSHHGRRKGRVVSPWRENPRNRRPEDNRTQM